MCNYCCLAIFPFSTTSTEKLISLFSESAPPDTEYSSACDSQLFQPPIEWFSTTINGYYKKNLKIGHLNVNSLLGKADEVINLLDECAFDILFITESKIDGTTSSSLFAHSQYRIIRRDRKRGGGPLVCIRSNVTAHRQINLEPEGVESICLDVKGYANNWFLICACYRSPGKCKITDFIPACATAAERMYVKRKEIMFIGDFNMNMHESPDNPTALIKI